MAMRADRDRVRPITDPSGILHPLDDVSIDELREAVEHMHGVPARFVETVEVET